MEVNEQIRSFIVHNFYVPATDRLDDEDSLLERGIVDSTGVLEVVGFIEETLGVTVEDGELSLENLDSVARIAAYVRRKRGE